jgi:AraC-like DNA-binding protein
VTYGARWTGFRGARDALDVPLRTADPEAFRQAALICQRELEKIDTDASMAAAVRRVLLEQQNGFPSLGMTARLLHVAPRTLHRRLVEEGTSYRNVLEEVRRTLAIAHVRSGHLSMKEIAYALGYSDLANFRRAFKRWERVAPTRYRRT